MAEIIIQIAVQAALFLYPLWRICTKAGVSPLVSLTVLIPGFGILICAIILAILKWDVQPVEGE